MVKARLGGLKPCFFFGLSDGNLRKLQEKKPIIVDLLTMGGPSANVMISWGPTEEEIAKELNEFVLTEDQDEEAAFPRGKLNPEDQGALVMALRVENNTVIMSFNKSIDWLGLGRAEVEGLIKALEFKLSELPAVT